MFYSKVAGDHRVERAATGIRGFDEITGGGLPRSHVTLVAGGPGSGKTIFSVQSLVSGGIQHGESGLLVTFEESPEELKQSAGNFGWPLSVAGGRRVRRKVVIHDARPNSDMRQSGQFDLNGLLAGLTAQVEAHGIKRVVFDAIDVLLAFLEDEIAERREIYRLFDWLERHRLTGVMTAKFDLGELQHLTPRQSFLPYLSACVVLLQNRLQGPTLQRSLRVAKYRGTSHSANEHSMVIGPRGLEISSDDTRRLDYRVSGKRVSSGVKRLDTMLGGGYYRGSSILVSGSPGTTKTTLAGCFIAAACRRGERALFVSFDEAPAQIVRNLSSVGIKLAGYVKSGHLHLRSLRTGSQGPDDSGILVQREIEALRPQVLVIDPISALVDGPDAGQHRGIAQGLIAFAKSLGMTVFVTALLGNSAPEEETTRSNVSTIADTWIHLSFRALGGERNRALTIVKSRGMWHSNQVRELTLSRHGVTLADVYSAGGEVLLGTARLEKEQKVARAEQDRTAEFARKRGEIGQNLRRLAVQLDEVRADITARQAELNQLDDEEGRGRGRRSADLIQVLQSRGVEPAVPGGRRVERKGGRR